MTDLDSCGYTDEARKLGKEEDPSTIKEISISGTQNHSQGWYMDNKINKEGIRLMTAGCKMPNLQLLEITFSNIGPDGASLLARSNWP